MLNRYLSIIYFDYSFCVCAWFQPSNVWPRLYPTKFVGKIYEERREFFKTRPMIPEAWHPIFMNSWSNGVKIRAIESNCADPIITFDLHQFIWCELLFLVVSRSPTLPQEKDNSARLACQESLSTATVLEQLLDLPMGDVWNDAEILSVYRYVRGSKHLRLPPAFKPLLFTSAC